MSSWLRPWNTILNKPPLPLQPPPDCHHVNFLSSSFSPVSEKVMISPKAIAITKKTAVYASGDDTSSTYHHQYIDSHELSSTATLSAASIALSAELIKKQQLLGLTDSITTTTDQASTKDTMITTTTAAKSISSSLRSTRQCPPLRSISTTSQASSITCTFRYQIPMAMQPSPKLPTKAYSNNVTANGYIFYKSHIIITPPSIITPSSCIANAEYQHDDQKSTTISATAAAITTSDIIEEGSTNMSISIARKHLKELIQPSPINSLSGTTTTDAVYESPDLQQTEHLGHHEQISNQPMNSSLDQTMTTDKCHTDQQQQQQQQQYLDQTETGFWSRLFSYPPTTNHHKTHHTNDKLNDSSNESIPPLSPPPSPAKVPVVMEPLINSNHTKNGKRNNKVLPLFRSQYHVPPSSSESLSTTTTTTTTTTTRNDSNNKTTGNIFGRTMSSINQWILLTSSNHTLSDHILDPTTWKQHLKSKFAQFIDDMKSDPHGLAGKKVVIIGVHGWFPMKLVRSIIGESTGTSLKFCEQMVTAVKKYFEQEHGLYISEETTTITSIPLEGEGKVEDRVDMLYTNLINHTLWLEAVSSADVILWATHSQGTPVSTILIHRLLERGHIHTHRQSIGMLAMAGISHGPFPVLKGNLVVKYFEADAARELFEFMDSESDISIKYRVSLAYILQHGIKLTLVGSMQDQVVPFYSAIISAIHHPNIVRSVYIDGHAFTPENGFIIHLITFALGLRNAGLSDHGLLTHLSEVLAGSLYALEGGHSTIYEELDVYYLAIQHLFETYPLGKAVLINNNNKPPPSLPLGLDNNNKNQQDNVSKEPTLRSFQAKSIKNPYYLPWAMRGICEDRAILENTIWADQLDQLRHKFDAWQPNTAKLRSVKLRLEPFTLPIL